jgi:lysophospholipase L1-like esterase
MAMAVRALRRVCYARAMPDAGAGGRAARKPLSWLHFVAALVAFTCVLASSALPASPGLIQARRPQSPRIPPPTVTILGPRGALHIAIVGDSISRTIVAGNGPSGFLYSNDPATAYPAYFVTTLRARVTNLAVPSAQTDEMIAQQVPLVPRDSDVVVYEGGANDLLYTGLSALSRIDAVVAAIRARAPRAKIVLVGVRYCAYRQPDEVRTWDERERDVARTASATYIDLRTIFPSSDRHDWPDGLHPNEHGARSLAALIAQKIASATR